MKGYYSLIVQFSHQKFFRDLTESLTGSPSMCDPEMFFTNFRPSARIPLVFSQISDLQL
jgi:hypothetical protein